jgi:CheY-like chemotaxis protein
MQQPSSALAQAGRRPVSEILKGFGGEVFSGGLGRDRASESPRAAAPGAGVARLTEARGRYFPQRIALHHRPGSLVLLDDVPDYLEVLAEDLLRDWHVEKFGSGLEAINYLQQEPPLWEADFWAQQQILERWHGGQRLIPQILKYWAENQSRYELTKVCIVDYLMPGMDGLEVLEELHGWPGFRVLLTGAYDSALGIEAFNRGSIDQFLPKHTADFGQKLRSIIGSLMERPNARYHQIWSSTLSLAQHQLLSQTDIASDLSGMISRTFVEWIVIGDPFGVLGVDATGNVSWLQLEPTDQLELLAEMATHCGGTSDDASQILAGKVLSDVQLIRNLGIQAKPTAVPAFCVGTKGRLLCAVHRVDHRNHARALSYKAWLATANRRTEAHST